MSQPKLNIPKTRTLFRSDGGRITLARTVPDADAEDEEPQITLSGYAIKWDSLSSDRGGYQVRLKPGSALFTTPCLALYHHDFHDLLGTTANGTLRITPDQTGVKVEIDLPDTQVARDVAELIEDEYLSGMSFSMANGFEDYTEEKAGDKFIINVTKFTCDEVTITAIPAFLDTSIGLKNPEAEDAAEDETPDTSERQKQSARWQKHRLDFAKM